MFSSPAAERRNRIINSILSLVAIVLVIGFGLYMFFDNKTDQEQINQSIKASKQDEDEQRKKVLEDIIREQELEKQKELDSFYQKLADGFDVNILVIGDNIGACDGASDTSTSWTKLMTSYLEKHYDVNVRLKNISMSGNSSYAGYVRTMVISDRIEYDLAIICYGQNDKNEKFQMYYESIIRAVRSKYNNCSIISVLESSQRKYTSKMEVIQKLAEHYGIQVADTIKPFNDGGKNAYDKLTDDGINPNDKGQQIYSDVITSLIDKEVDNYTDYNANVIEPVNDGVSNFTTIKAINARDFARDGNNYTYEMDSSVKGIVGIDYKYISGKNGCRIFLDGKEYKAPEADPKTDELELRILLLSDKPIEISRSIEIRFDDDEQFDGFRGICISAEEDSDFSE